jgi:hypothetical protein
LGLLSIGLGHRARLDDLDLERRWSGPPWSTTLLF